MLRKVYYYAIPSQPALDKFPDLSTTGVAFQCKRWIFANHQRGYLGMLNCNRLADWAFWHYPCEFCLSSTGL